MREEREKRKEKEKDKEEEKKKEKKKEKEGVFTQGGATKSDNTQRKRGRVAREVGGAGREKFTGL